MHLGEVCLMTRDAPRLAAFYRQLLSLPPQENHDRHQFIVAEEVSLAVWDDGTPISAVQTASLAFTTDDIQEMTRAIEAAGEPVTIGPKMGVDGNWQVWTVDPDGNKIEIMQYSENAMQLKV